MTANKDVFMRSDRNDEIHAEIKSSFLTRLIDDGPSLVAAVVVTAASTVIGWGIYSDLAAAFYASAHDRFLVMLALVCTLFATAGFGFGRSAGIRRGRRTPNAALYDDTGQVRRRRDEGTFALMADENGEFAEAAAAFALKPKAQRLQFLSEAAQELRAPLTSMCLAARIIRKHHESTPEVVERFGETLVFEADKLGGTIDEFLDLTRMEYGCVDWQDRDLEPAELLNAAISEIEPLAIGYGVGVSFVLESELTPILADYERIRQILTVLLGITVRDAADDVEVCIQIAGANGGWVISVGDSRRVYTHADARRVVSWGNPDTDEEDRADDPAVHGIGLNVCRQIVSRYEGRLWVEGNLAESGCVRVTIPYPTEQASARATAAAARTQKSASPTLEQSEAPDLASRHEAAVRALSERASHEDSDEDDLRFLASSQSDEAHTNEESLEAAADSETEFESPAASRAPAAQGGRSVAVEPSSTEGLPDETPMLDGAESPKAIPNRPDLRSANIPAMQAPTTPATAGAKAAPVIEDSAPDFTNVEAIRTQSSSKLESTEQGGASKLSAPEGEPSKPPATRAQATVAATSPTASATGTARGEEKGPEVASEHKPLPTPADAAPVAKPADSQATERSRIPERPATLRRSALPGGGQGKEDDATTAPRPVTGMAISARRRPGTRPMLALSDPGSSTSTPDSSVRAASDKDLLELAFGSDGDNGEVSREEAELVAKATGSTIARYNPKSRTARSVRSAAPQPGRDTAKRSNAPNGNRNETSRTGERASGRLDDNVAKRLGIK